MTTSAVLWMYCLQGEYHWELQLSRSHQGHSVKLVKRLTTADYLESLLMSPTSLSGETIRCSI